MDSRATIIKVADTDMDDCTFCTVRITSDTDKQWVVANVYEDCCLVGCKKCGGTGRKWDRLEHWHKDCYDRADSPYEAAVGKRAPKSKGVRD